MMMYGGRREGRGGWRLSSSDRWRTWCSRVRNGPRGRHQVFDQEPSRSVVVRDANVTRGHTVLVRCTARDRNVYLKVYLNGGGGVGFNRA